MISSLIIVNMDGLLIIGVWIGLGRKFRLLCWSNILRYDGLLIIGVWIGLGRKFRLLCWSNILRYVRLLRRRH